MQAYREFESHPIRQHDYINPTGVTKRLKDQFIFAMIQDSRNKKLKRKIWISLLSFTTIMIISCVYIESFAYGDAESGINSIYLAISQKYPIILYVTVSAHLTLPITAMLLILTIFGKKPKRKAQ
ncbi:hypothetical protein [Rhabdaerophilum sp. SD176]|uniref:hypothetical protein n=1 Tax=Rhabdaerophilum sp. SD176 TaxID=2983548 RepID=UPI0024DF57E2|nr:hypothetical protein [Rhabdaerophilum sp. SD176]